MVRIVAEEFLTDERDRKYYADHYTCCPPPLFIIIITLVEVSIAFATYSLIKKNLPGSAVAFGFRSLLRPVHC